MNITMIGTGYVGLVSGAGLADFGMQVICVDKDAERISLLEKGIVPFYEPGLQELVSRNVKNGRLCFSTDLAKAVGQSLVVFVAVGTPDNGNGEADLTQVAQVAETLAGAIDDYKVLVMKSTVPVGTNRWFHGLVQSKLAAPNQVDVVSNPEFLREGSAIGDFMRPDRVVIGSDSAQALAIVKDLYRPLYLIETPFVVTGLETAELIKYASNAFLATKISFINEVANLCEKVGADVHHVAKAMGLDKRIGPKFLHAGPGFGGSCFPKDTRAFALTARKMECPLRIVESVIEVNTCQRMRMIDKIDATLGSLEGKKIGVLGLAFKPNTSDVRESPAIDIIKSMIDKGAHVVAYDPEGAEEFRKVVNSQQLFFADDPYAVAKDSHALVVLTEWNEFRNLDLGRIKSLLEQPVIIDLRNIYEPQAAAAAGFTYLGVGRGTSRCS
ncbi:MAG TPA: UDP-glucose/GDP-mannose dehydrogenase family protein [Thermodesulfobacteriota bacterium]|nr:UDP-glucose/GDP-mannose dehydrogenase family protein [Thermodesulfobacteriota bacterium]